VRTDYMSGLPP